MQNYLGVGVDARIALDWHRRRQADPGLFTSRFLNKLRYAAAGARQLFRPNFVRLCANLQVVADGVPLELPPVRRAQLCQPRATRVACVSLRSGPGVFRLPAHPPRFFRRAGYGRRHRAQHWFVWRRFGLVGLNR